MTDGPVQEALVLGIVMGAATLVGVAFWFGSAPLGIRTPMALTCATGVAYLFGRWPLFSLIQEQSPPLAQGLFAVGSTAAGFFWAFAIAVFADRQGGRRLYVPAAVLFASQVADQLWIPQPWEAVWDPAVNVFVAVLAAHALYLTLRGWKGDLVEERRQLRLPLVVAFAVIALLVLVLAFQAGLAEAGRSTEWGQRLVSLVLVLFLIPCALLVESRRLFAAPEARRASASEAEEEQLLLRLRELMEEERAWGRERLTVAGLAEMVGAPEHRLRRLINQKLGHRNFAGFVNGYRIAAAKQLLTDNGADRTVAEVAFEVGFGSLGPFNRAFKEATGMTPSEWKASPNPK